MPEIVIRTAVPDDGAELAAVRASATTTLRKTYRPRQSALNHKQQIASTSLCLVAVWEGRIVGAVEYLIRNNAIHFFSLDVHSDFRRRGIARRLLDELTQIGRSRGAVRLSAYTIVQTGNVEIFERLGFRVITEEFTDDFESDRFESLSESLLERKIEK